MVAVCLQVVFIMSVQKYFIAISITLIGAGVTLGAPLGVTYLGGESHHVISISAAPAPSASKRSTSADVTPIVKGIPRHVSIPSLGVDTAVEDGYYNAKTGQWTISEESAFFATPTDEANSKAGNTFIYGHNSKKIFGKLLQIKPGAQAIIATDSGAQFIYTFASTVAVKPTDAQVLDYSGTPRLTLQTCSGLWNQNRQIFYFNLTSYTR